MTDATVTLSAVTPSRGLSPLKAFLRRLIAARAERVTLNQLSRLSDRELNDIGISRGQIREIAREHREQFLAGL